MKEMTEKINYNKNTEELRPKRREWWYGEKSIDEMKRAEQSKGHKTTGAVCLLPRHRKLWVWIWIMELYGAITHILRALWVGVNLSPKSHTLHSFAGSHSLFHSRHFSIAYFMVLSLYTLYKLHCNRPLCL